MPNSTLPSHGPWLGVDEISGNLRLSRTTLYRLRKRGLLKPGIHYFRTTPGRTSRILWCPVTIREAMVSWTPEAEVHTESVLKI